MAAFSRSFLESPAGTKADTRVVLTIVGGNIVYEDR
jgi:predicted amidohydrolase YtcJ